MRFRSCSLRKNSESARRLTVSAFEPKNAKPKRATWAWENITNPGGGVHIERYIEAAFKEGVAKYNKYNVNYFTCNTVIII
jgi:hypothetical protein